MEDFIMKVIDSLVNCNQYFNEMKKYDNIVCFGAGSKGRQSVEILKKFGINPIAYCDNNEELWGTMNDGIKIMGYRDIRSTFDEYVILITCTLKNAMEIYNDLIANEEKNPIYFFSNPYKAENKILTMKKLS
jgi:FlaA1/EpsC-like NDP-sugar epimerase